MHGQPNIKILKIVMVKGGIFLEILSHIFLFIFWCSSLLPTMFCHLPTMVFTCIQFCLTWNVVLYVCTLKKCVGLAPGNPRLLGMGSQWPPETVGTSLYLTAVTSHFLSACFTYKTLTCNELCVH
jgi:hypothetical protein